MDLKKNNGMFCQLGQLCGQFSGKIENIIYLYELVVTSFRKAMYLSCNQAFYT